MSFHTRRARAASSKSSKELWAQSFLDTQAREPVQQCFQRAKELDTETWSQMIEGVCASMTGEVVEQKVTLLLLKEGVVASGVFHLLRAIARANLNNGTSL